MNIEMGSHRKTKYENVYWSWKSLRYRFKDENGKWVFRNYGAGSPKDAKRAQMDAQERADRIRAGVLDPKTEEIENHSRRPVEELAEEYIEFLETKGTKPENRKTCRNNIDRWVKECEIDRIIDADPSRCAVWLSRLTNIKTGQLLSARSQNAYRTSVLGLCKWASDYGRVLKNPLPPKLIPKADEDADRRRLSRAMSKEEFGWLIAHVPDYRRHFYVMAALSGIRWVELARLRWRSIDFEARSIKIESGKSKNKKAAELPIHDDVMGVLQEMGLKHPNAQVLPVEPRIKTWRRDIDNARKAWIDAAGSEVEGARREESEFLRYIDCRGRRIDRKCLRMTFCTWLKDADVDLRDAQMLMRHGDPKLTSNIYTDVRLVNLGAEVGKIDMGQVGGKVEQG